MKHFEELSVFLEVTRRGSFAEAARSLNLPTTTVSRKIQLLESELEIRLFNRTTRSLSLTEVGERLIPKAKMALESMNELKREADFHTNNTVGTLNISAPAETFQLLSPLFAEFLSMYPGIRLEIDSSSRNQDLVALRADFAFRLGPLNDSSLIAIPLVTIRYLLLGSSTLIDSRPTLEHPSELANWPCIRNHVDGLLFPWRFVIEGELFDLDSEYTILSDNLSVSKQMALSGAGLVYLPKSVAKDNLKSDELISVNEEWMPPARELYLVYPNKTFLPSKSKKFIEFVRNNITEIEQIHA